MVSFDLFYFCCRILTKMFSLVLFVIKSSPLHVSVDSYVLFCGKVKYFYQYILMYLNDCAIILSCNFL